MLLTVLLPPDVLAMLTGRLYCYSLGVCTATYWSCALYAASLAASGPDEWNQTSCVGAAMLVRGAV